MRFMVLHCSIITIKRPLRAWYCFIILKSRLKYGETLTSFFSVSSRCMIEQANTQAAKSETGEMHHCLRGVDAPAFWTGILIKITVGRPSMRFKECLRM